MFQLDVEDCHQYQLLIDDLPFRLRFFSTKEKKIIKIFKYKILTAAEECGGIKTSNRVRSSLCIAPSLYRSFFPKNRFHLVQICVD
jgi:hypothetical protein